MGEVQIGALVFSFVGWSLGGLIALFIARMAYHLITPFDPKEELVRDRNMAVGVSNGMFLVAAAIILHGLISGEPLGLVWWMEGLVMLGLYLAGLALLGLGRVVLRLLVKFDLDEQIHQLDNPAVGVLEGCSYVGFAIIIHAAL